MNMGKPGENHFHDVMAINDSHWSGQQNPTLGQLECRCMPNPSSPWRV